jgi:hypothetical protein
MADNKIKVIIDVVGDKASASLRNFKSDLAGAEGAFGKMKVAGTAAFDQIKGAGAEMAVAAGAALVTFGVKAASAFTGLALEAGKFADATGLAVEDASRWIEVAGDVGIGADQIQGAILKMNREIANGGLDQFADDVVRAKDGTVEASATFESLVTKIGAIKDPTDRAAAAQKAFGRGFADIAELMEMDATELRAALEGVSDAKIIDEGELKRAKEMRDRIDQLKDKFEDFQLEVGEKVVPVLIALADQAILVADAVGTVGSVIDETIDIVERAVGVNEDHAESQGKITAGTWAAVDATGKLVAVTDEMHAAAVAEANAMKASAEELEAFEGLVGLVAGAQTQLEETISAANEAMLEQAGILQEQIDAQRAAADSAFALRDAEDDLAEKVAGANDEMKEADGDLRKVRGVLDDVAQSAGEVADSTVRVWEEQAKANGTTLTAAQRQEMWNQKMIGSASTLDGPMRDAVLDYAANVNGIPPEKVSEIRALLDAGKIVEAEALLNEASRTRDAAIQADALTDQAEQDLAYLARDRTSRIFAVGGGVRVMDSGGNIPSGQSALVAEKRPEFVNGVLVNGPADVTGGAETGRILGRMGGAGGRSSGTVSNTYSITVNVAPGGDPASTGRALVEAIQDYERVNSSRWRAS